MAKLGLSCNVAKGSIFVRDVTFDGTAATEVFSHKGSASEDEALQLRSLAHAFETLLADLNASVVVVRSADHHAAARINDATALRLRAEGVLLASAREKVIVVRRLTGKQIGETCGETKQSVETRAT